MNSPLVGALLAGTFIVISAVHPVQIQDTVQKQQLTVLEIEGFRTLGAQEIVVLEATARKLGSICLQNPTATQAMKTVLAEEHSGLFKRALALRALILTGAGTEAFALVKDHPDRMRLEQITSTLEGTPPLAQI